MIYSLSGRLILKKPQFIVVETNGIGFKVLTSTKTLHKLPKINSKMAVFCYTSVKQDGIDIYGFLDEKELELFEMLNSISGIGPKIALKILNTSKTKELLSAIGLGRHDILTKISGIGKKTAERVVLELRDKIKNQENEDILLMMDFDDDIEKALKKFGYKKQEIQEALKNISPKIEKIEERLKIALKNLARK